MKDSDFAVGFKQGQEHGKQIMLEKIEDIKAEIDQKWISCGDPSTDYGLELALYIIDKHISGKEKE